MARLDIPVLKQVSGAPERMPSYTDPTLPLAAGLVPAILEYLREDPGR